jgi:hypothetical protein
MAESCILPPRPREPFVPYDQNPRYVPGYGHVRYWILEIVDSSKCSYGDWGLQLTSEPPLVDTSARRTPLY